MGLFLHRISTLVQFFLGSWSEWLAFLGVEATDQPLKTSTGGAGRNSLVNRYTSVLLLFEQFNSDIWICAMMMMMVMMMMMMMVMLMLMLMMMMVMVMRNQRIFCFIKISWNSKVSVGNCLGLEFQIVPATSVSESYRQVCRLSTEVYTCLSVSYFKMAVSGNQPLSPQIQAPGFLNSSEFLACLRLDQEYVPTPGSGGSPKINGNFRILKWRYRTK